LIERGESQVGRNAWPVDVLMTLVLLRFSEDGMSRRAKLLKLYRHLMLVIEQNLEAGPEGGLQVAKRVAADMLISLGDPQARHGRTSKSRTFKGFKLHVLGDAISGLIVSLAVTPGNIHDG
jgi:hypothetical protein